ncbi:TMEM67, partial [Acrasis kona]
MFEFHECLNAERDNKVRNRGLVNEIQGDKEPVQTFEIYITNKTRAVYNEKLIEPIAQENLKNNMRIDAKTDPNDPQSPSTQQLLSPQQQNTTLNDLSSLRLYNILSGALTRIRSKAQALHLYNAYMSLNDFLKQYIHDLSDKRDQICDRQTTNRLGFPPETLHKDIFFNDPDYSFKKVTMMGQELKMMSFYILIFGFFDLFISNNIICFLIVYIVYLFIMQIRSILVTNNLAKK